MTFLDGLGSHPQFTTYSFEALRRIKADALQKLHEIVPRGDSFSFVSHRDPMRFTQIGSFAIANGPCEPQPSTFNLHAATTQDNAMRVIRACQVPKPILLEGSPGVGKTTLITALAQMSGHTLYRINLSDQTDLIDLFGSDLPVEGGRPGEFTWKDAEFLKALQEGNWVLLDEMNLAPQTVLEGLNAVLDHRGTVYIPELGRSFTRHADFRIFAAQNPLHQGGGRKGLPKSFINRFTKVYLEELSENDLLCICHNLFPALDLDILRYMISYNNALNDEICVKRVFAREGGPWEFNLRDVFRWATLLCASASVLHPVEHLCTVYLHRFRSVADRQHARRLFEKVFSMSSSLVDQVPSPSISSTHLQIGHFYTCRSNSSALVRPGCLLQSQLTTLQTLGLCVSHSWLSIITGPRRCGKSDVVRTFAHLTGQKLLEIAINVATDTTDILGSFEQIDRRGRILAIAQQVLSLVDNDSRSMFGSKLAQSRQCGLLRGELQISPVSASLPLILRIATRLLEQFNDGDADSEPAELMAKIREVTALHDDYSRFEWVDGPLVRAMKQGSWVALDGANLCNPSVLDRLNSLCEPDGVIFLSEKGLVDGKVQKLKPHPDFRLFMLVDPQYGELSRAMRNRGIEIALLDEPTYEDQNRLANHTRVPIAGHQNIGTEALTTTFDAMRRGLILPKMPARHVDMLWPSGYALDQNSLLSILIEHTTLFSLVPSLPPPKSDPLLNVFARIAIPAYFSHLTRFFATLGEILPPQSDLIQSLLQSFLPRFLSITMAPRTTHCKLQRVNPEFIVTKVSNHFTCVSTFLYLKTACRLFPELYSLLW
jgi:midasin